MQGHPEHVQLIWDREGAGTAESQSGSHLRVGPGGDWTPEQLLVIASESSVMTRFLRLAAEAGVEVLGYVSAAEEALCAEPAVRPSIVVRPCIVVGRETDRAPVQGLLASAGQDAPVARALGSALRIDAEIVVVPAAGGT